MKGIAKMGESILVANDSIVQQYVARATPPFWHFVASSVPSLLGSSNRSFVAKGGELLLGGAFAGCSMGSFQGPIVPSTGIIGFVGDEIFAAGFE